MAHSDMKAETLEGFLLPRYIFVYFPIFFTLTFSSAKSVRSCTGRIRQKLTPRVIFFLNCVFSVGREESPDFYYKEHMNG